MADKIKLAAGGYWWSLQASLALLFGRTGDEFGWLGTRVDWLLRRCGMDDWRLAGSSMSMPRRRWRNEESGVAVAQGNGADPGRVLAFVLVMAIFLWIVTRTWCGAVKLLIGLET